MSDPSDFEAPDSPPPPAYEFCQQEFDQKVSHALEASQSEPQPRFEDEEWEEWDEEKFAAAVASMSVGENAAAGSSTLPAVPVASRSPPPAVSGNGKAKSEEPANEWQAEVRPLRIAKKNTATRREKERPSWYTEAQLGEQRRPTLHVSSGAVAAPATRIMSPPPPISAYPEERNSTPPPMFTAVDNSLDGPPYEGVVMSYIPGDSRPASPLHSPPPIAAPMPFSAAHSASPPLGRRSLPQPPQANARPYTPSISPSARMQQQHQSLPAPARQLPQRASPRPSTTYSLKPPSFAPRLTFDPRVAYGSEKSSLFNNTPVEEPPPAKIDAAALYRYERAPEICPDDAYTWVHSSSVASMYSAGIPAAPSRIQSSAP